MGVRDRLRAQRLRVRRLGLATRHPPGGSGRAGPHPAHEGAMNRRVKSVVDLRGLPDVVFGPRDLMWWGTLGFILIEGFTLVLCAAAYVYLTQNYSTWPPENTPLPSLGAHEVCPGDVSPDPPRWPQPDTLLSE